MDGEEETKAKSFVLAAATVLYISRIQTVVVRLRWWPFLPLLAIEKAKTMRKVLSARISSRRGSLIYNRGSNDDDSVSSSCFLANGYTYS